MSNNPNNEYKQQPVYHQSQHPPIQYVNHQLQQQYVQHHAQQYNKHYLPLNQYGIAQKSASIDDYPTPSITPNSSISGAIPHHPLYQQNIIDPTNILPQINYYNNQHSNKSNNSNSTYISSTTAQSGNTGTSINTINTINSSGFSSENHSINQQQQQQQQIQMQMQMNNNNNHGQQQHQQQQQQHPLFDLTIHSSHSYSQSHGQQPIPIQYHPYDIPSYHNHAKHTQQHTILPRSSTSNINIMELDEMDNGLIAKVEDEKKSSSSSILNINKHHLHDHIIQTNNKYHNNQQQNTQNTQNTRQFELKTFAGDIRAYNTWIACIQNQYNDTIFFYVLYPKLCEYFIDIVKTARYPTVNDLSNVFTRHGAIANKYKNDNNTYLSIDRIHFISFWKWFKQCCQVIKELRFLWINDDANNNNKDIPKKVNGLGVNFFCQRIECESNLLASGMEGTFGLRLSSVVEGGVVLSYVEKHVVKKLQCKHVCLIRQSNGMYLCNKKILSLHDIIRNFVKLKFLYTPNRPIPKNKIF